MALSGATSLPGGDTLLMLEIAILDKNKYYDINYAPANTLTPAQLNTLMLPELGIEDKGVVLRESKLWWLDAHMVVEYSKVASWVALGNQDYAIVVFSVDQNVPVGTVIDY